jgi:hypothetical protein
LEPQIIIADVCCSFLSGGQFDLLTSIRHIINPRFSLTTPLDLHCS